MRYFLLVFCLLTGPFLRAQPSSQPRPPAPATIAGVVVDSLSGKPLREASVALLSGRDSSYVTYTVTDGDGRFVLRKVAPGAYQLLVTSLGYASQRRPVRMLEAVPVAVGTVQLVALTHDLGEVVIEQERAPVSIQGDTIAFNAQAFKTQPNAAVEALLKKLPGVEVDRDGTIRAQGQTVNRVLVDGKPFFGDDPKIATRNLPADIIDQVQLYDQQSDQAAFSGMDDGNRQRTINLTIKRDKRKGYFGTNAAGGGTDGRYRGQLGLNRFNNGRQLSALASANNVNQQDFGDTGGLPTPDGGFGPGGPLSGSLGGGRVVVAGGSGSRTGANPAAQQPTTITETGAAGLNYRDAWGRRAEVATSYFATRAVVTSDHQRRRENVAGGEDGAPLITNQSAAGRTHTLGHRANLRLDYVLDSLTSLRVAPTAAWQTVGQLSTTDQQTTATQQLLNRSLTRYDATNQVLAGAGNALLMRRFGRAGRLFSANLNTTLNNQDGAAINQATNTFFDSSGTVQPTQIHQRIGQDEASRTHVLTFSYVEPLSLVHKLEVRAERTDTRARAARTVADYADATGQFDQLNPAFSNQFDYGFTATRAGLTVQTRRLRYGYAVGVDAQRADLRVENQSLATTSHRRFTTLLPSAMFTWTGSRSRTLRFNYRTRLAPPTATQLQPVVDNTNPLNLQVGNPALRPETYHLLTATYQQFNVAANRSIFGVLTATGAQNRIVSATTYDARGIQLTQPVNADGYRALTGFLSAGQRLTPQRLNFNLTTNAATTRGLSFVDSQPNVAHTWQLGQGVSVNSAFNEKLELGLGANLTWQQARYRLLPQQNTAYWTQRLTADLYYQLPGRLVLTTDLWYTATTGRAAGYNQRVVLWNGGLARQFFRNRQGELKLSVFDLLGQNRGITRNVTDTYLEDVRSRVLMRYWLLSFTYQLRRFGV